MILTRYLLAIITVVFLVPSLAFGQSVTVKSISEEDSKVLVRNGWELVYTTDQFSISDFVLDNNGIVIATEIDDAYHLVLLNNEHIQKKDKSVVKFSKLRMGYPYFFNSGDGQVFGPCDKLYFEIDMNKLSLGRNRYPFKSIKGKEGIYYRPDTYYKGISGDMDLGSATTFNSNEKLQTQYLLDYSLREVDTLYKVSHTKDVFNFNAISPYLQFEVSNDERFIFILDNINGLLVVLDEDKKIRQIELKELDFAKSTFMKGFPINLRKDAATDQIYLVHAPLGNKNGELYRVSSDGTVVKLQNERFESISSVSKVYNGKLYTIFKIEELKTSAIYAVDLEQE